VIDIAVVLLVPILFIEAEVNGEFIVWIVVLRLRKGETSDLNNTKMIATNSSIRQFIGSWTAFALVHQNKKEKEKEAVASFILANILHDYRFTT